MIEINLLPEELRRRASAKIQLPEIPVKKTVYAAIAAVVGIQALFTLYTGYLGFSEASLVRSIAVLKGSNSELLQRKYETLEMQKGIKEIRNLTQRSFYWSALLNELTNAMTKGIWLRDLQIIEVAGQVTPPAPVSKEDRKKKAPPKPVVQREKTLVLAGSAVGSGQETAFIGKFLKQLKDTPFFTDIFSDIRPSNINQKKAVNYEVYEFTINCRFKKEKLP